MKCEQCGRALRPAESKTDGEDTFRGFWPCKCSREAWLDSEAHAHGVSFEEYNAAINEACPWCGQYRDVCACDPPSDGKVW